MASSQAHLGTIHCLKKSFGFIRSPSFATDVFFHSNTAAGFAALNEGDAVEFTLAQPAAGGSIGSKKVAASVRPSSESCPLFHVDSCVRHGMIVSVSRSAAGFSSGMLRWITPESSVQYLSFRDAASAPGAAALTAGQVVSFRMLTDLRQKQLHESGASASKHATHAFLRATDVTAVSREEEARLAPAVQQQLVLLAALAETFDTAKPLD